MLIDAYQPEDVFARVPELAAQIDPVLKQLDMLLDDDDLYQIQSRRCSASFLLLPGMSACHQCRLHPPFA